LGIFIMIMLVLHVADHFLDIVGRILENAIKIKDILKEQKKAVPRKRKRTKR
jgi:hypothetical protein